MVQPPRLPRRRELDAPVKKLLTSLLAVDSRPGGSGAVIVLEKIAEFLRTRGVDAVRIISPGRAPLLHARAPGHREACGLLLFSHADTADWDASKWTLPPLGGKMMADGRIPGRGALDCKSLAAVQAGLLADVAAGKLRKRSVGLIVTTDEESGGFEGMGKLMVNSSAASLYRWALGEGGGYFLPDDGGFGITCQHGERGRWIFPANPHAQPTEVFHYSRRARRRLRRAAVHRLQGTSHPDPRAWGSCFSGRTGVLKTSPWEKEGSLRRWLGAHIDDWSNGNKVADSTVTALKGRLYRAIRRNAKTLGWTHLLPTISPGYSDARHLRSAGLSVFGYFPMGRRERLETMHGPDEAIHGDTVSEAIDTIGSIVDEVAG